MGKRFKTPTNKWQRFLIESAKDYEERWNEPEEEEA